MRSLFLREALGYTAASACALAVDITVLWVLVRFWNWYYLAAATISFLTGGVVAYKLSVLLAFKNHRIQDRRMELLGFIAIGAIGLMVNSIVVFMAVNSFGIDYLFAKCIAAGFTFLSNFFMRRQILFMRQPAI